MDFEDAIEIDQETGYVYLLEAQIAIITNIKEWIAGGSFKKVSAQVDLLDIDGNKIKHTKCSSWDKFEKVLNDHVKVNRKDL